MGKGSERRPHVEQQYGNRVSSAVWPVNTRKVVATGKAAQRRRDLIMQDRWWIILADILAVRVLFILTTLLVVVISLLVAILGREFWYLLLLPLLLFIALLILPLFLARRIPAEMVPPALLLKSGSGMLSDETPATPLADSPLVRVLETYDLRETPFKHFLTDPSDEETGEYLRIYFTDYNLPAHKAESRSVETDSL
jgi:hypothetical protein